MTYDMRTTQEVEATRCMRNDKPYRNTVQKAQAKSEAKRMKDGSFVSYVPIINHETCSCGKKTQDQCSHTSSGRNSRIKRLRNA